MALIVIVDGTICKTHGSFHFKDITVFRQMRYFRSSKASAVQQTQLNENAWVAYGQQANFF